MPAPLAGFDQTVAVDEWCFTPADLLRVWPADIPLASLISGHEAPLSKAPHEPSPRGPRWSILGAPDQDAAWSCEPGQTDWARLDALARSDEPWLWVGFVGYDAGRALEPVVSRIEPDERWPESYWAPLRGWLAHDAHGSANSDSESESESNVRSAAPTSDAPAPAPRKSRGTWYRCGTWATDPPAWLEDLVVALNHPESAPPTDPPQLTVGPLEPDTPREVHMRRVQQVLDFIRAGDVFQVNLAHRMSATAQGNPRDLAQAWLDGAPAWYSAYLELDGIGADARQVVVSGSPELFLAVDHGEVVTRPIKGTASSDTPAQDLIDSDKDAAELHMIVDLMRNDLGRVCRFGTVVVDESRAIETHPGVHHGVASVRGELRDGVGMGTLLRATLPPGSVTGTPKVRAMQIIESLESSRRGPYCGAIGWLGGGVTQGPRGSAPRGALNVAIRTALLTRQPEAAESPDSPASPSATQPTDSTVSAVPPAAWKLRYSVGGGIVADSSPQAEWDETLAKARALREVLARPHRPLT